MRNVTDPKRRRLDHFIILMLCSSISVLWGGIGYANAGLVDFRAVYWGARCLIEHHDPYSSAQMLKVYQQEDGVFPTDPVRNHIFRAGTFVGINLPTTLLLAAPLALLKWGAVDALWIALTAGLFTLAVFLVWKQARSYAPRLSLLLACLLAANTELLYMIGNTAGVVVALSAIAAWCLLNEEQTQWGTLSLGLALAIKPHDAGLVWLYLVLLGGTNRRRAFQALAITVALALPAVLWVWHVAPNWASELHANLQAGAAPGGVNAPLPSFGRDADMVIDLQAAICLFSNRPAVYNGISYLISGGLFLVWIVRTMFARGLRGNPWLGLAAGVAPLLLVSYHRGYDAKLVLLTIPACAMLWSAGGVTKWLAAVFTTTSVVFTADVPLNIFLLLSRHPVSAMSGAWGKALSVVLLAPTPLVLLAMGVFYLWVYVKNPQPSFELTVAEHSDRAQSVPSSAQEEAISGCGAC